MNATHGNTKIDLVPLLRFVKDNQERPLIDKIMARFDVQERAARDNLRVLIKGGWVEEYRLTSDQRKKRYRVTSDGYALLTQGLRAEFEVARARQKFSTCSHSPRRPRDAARSSLLDAKSVVLREQWENV
jgi:DNA-binding MarR family transcriptional regulator